VIFQDKNQINKGMKMKQIISGAKGALLAFLLYKALVGLIHFSNQVNAEWDAIPNPHCGGGEVVMDVGYVVRNKGAKDDYSGDGSLAANTSYMADAKDHYSAFHEMKICAPADGRAGKTNNTWDPLDGWTQTWFKTKVGEAVKQDAQSIFIFGVFPDK
jgi:hypothetical protein